MRFKQKSRAAAAVGTARSSMCGSSPMQSNEEQSSTRFSRKVKKDSMVVVYKVNRYTNKQVSVFTCMPVYVFPLLRFTKHHCQQRHSYIETIFHLPEICSAGILVEVHTDLADAWQRVHDDHLLLRNFHDLRV